MKGRAAALLAIIGVLGLLVGIYVRTTSPPPAADRPADAPQIGERLETPPEAPFIMVRSLRADDSHGKLGLAPLDRPDGPRFIAPLSCERVFFAGGRGVCLTIGADGIRNVYAAEIFDAAFQVRGRVRLTGVPSRVRLSADGRLAGITVFEQGHSYAESGYSTRTSLVDIETATDLGDLESFAVTKDGQPFRAVDFNFWGVTFAQDGQRFYATLASAGVKYLIEGDVRARTARVIARDVECPSLSPDNTRVAYKKAYTDARGIGWTLHVLDLRTSEDTTLGAETRSVDDQVEWLDDQHVLYHLPSSGGADIWVLPVDGQTPPRVLMSMAYSPAVVR